MEILSILMVAMMIEAVVEAIKPLWKADGTSLSAAEMVSILIGVLVAVTCRINMLAPFVQLDAPVWMEYVFYALTGIALGRGPSFVHDLWTRLKEWSVGDVETARIGEGVLVEDGLMEDVTEWSLEKIRAFCAFHGVNCLGCEAREDYLEAMGRWMRANDDAEPKDPETPRESVD